MTPDTQKDGSDELSEIDPSRDDVIFRAKTACKYFEM